MSGCPRCPPDSQLCPYSGSTSGCSEAFLSLYRVLGSTAAGTTWLPQVPAWLPIGWSRLPDTWRCQITGIWHLLDLQDSWTLGLSHTWGYQTFGEARSWGCRAPEAARSLGQVDTWAFGLLRAAILQYRLILGSLGTQDCETPGATGTTGQTDPRAVVHLGLPDPRYNQSLRLLDPRVSQNPELLDTHGCRTPGAAGSRDSQTAGDSPGSGASKPP